jgi:hypothetical protein|tara:strand:+ start:1009 stop:1293 length:285 start_codon:yes stop_codon:yes gene_type:complete
MAIDWDQFDIDVDQAAKRSANATDEILASKVSSLTSMTDAEVKELLPLPTDVKALGKLLKIVQSAENRNTKINQIVNNAEEFSGVVLALTKKLV